MSGYRFSVLVARDMKGWEASCPDFPDCRARGSSYEDAVANLKDLVQILIEDGLGDDEPVLDEGGLGDDEPVLDEGGLGDDEPVLDEGGLGDDETVPQAEELCFTALNMAV